MQTLEKLPQILPKIKKTMKNTNQILNCEAILRIPSMQNWTNTTASWR